MSAASFPKIELHVHLEGTVGATTLLEMAKRNAVRLPFDTATEMQALYDFRDFRDFVRVWILTTNVMRRAGDFTQVVEEYAARVASFGAVYIEACFSPVERVMRGLSWEEVFEGYCDGVAAASERYGIVVRLTPEAYRGVDPQLVGEMVRYAGRYRDRGVVGVGLGGDERACPAARYAAAFAAARELGLGVVPHAGEFPRFPDGSSGADSLRETLVALQPVRVRHGIAAADDPALLDLMRDRGIVLDVCPTSNLRTRAIASLAEHPLPKLLRAGIPCTVGTDDPAIFDTDLAREYELAVTLGADPRGLYEAGVRGALCDDGLKSRLLAIGESTPWPSHPSEPT